MALFIENERKFAETISDLAFCNPFLPERKILEKEALGKEFIAADPVWSYKGELNEKLSNIPLLVKRVEELVNDLKQRLGMSVPEDDRDLRLYTDLVLFLLYHAYVQRFFAAIERSLETNTQLGTVQFYDDFVLDIRKYLEIPKIKLELSYPPSHLFSCFFQLARAFYYIFSNVIGQTLTSAELRGAIWQSIFTHDMRRYLNGLFSKMGDMTTLITGPSGTGKELVAKAIGLSRYIPYSTRTKSFEIDYQTSFYTLNVSALSPTLVESELFGHIKGAFTGAINGRVGWLESCGRHGTVFLDEVGEISMNIQVKLLRVLQDRSLYRLGESTPRSFAGKLIAATNRNLIREIEKGSFREDLYYRICSDIITTPPLSEQLRESQKELRHIVKHVVLKICGHIKTKEIVNEVTHWIERHLGRDYEWTGNFREMEQCVRNILIRQKYDPPRRSSKEGTDLAEELERGQISADELLTRYCTMVYAKNRNYEQTARQLRLDRRTVKKKVDTDLLDQIN